MKCQLARCTESEHHPERVGWLAWVMAEEPYYGPARDRDTGEVSSEFQYRSPYFCPDTGISFVIPHEGTELLPFSADIEPCSWDDWIANGGEPLPQEEGTP
jgi:hypothetical protein